MLNNPFIEEWVETNNYVKQYFRVLKKYMLKRFLQLILNDLKVKISYGCGCGRGGGVDSIGQVIVWLLLVEGLKSERFLFRYVHKLMKVQLMEARNLPYRFS